MRTTIVHALAELASLHTRPPFACGLRSFFHDKADDELAGPSRAADGTARLGRLFHGSRRSSTVALDQGGGQSVVCSWAVGVEALSHLCAAVQHAAWWAPRHGGVAVPRQWRPSAGRTGSLVRGIGRFERVKGAGAGHSPRPGTSPNRPKTRGAPPAADRAHGLYPAAEVAAAVHKSQYH